jgi:hypothetical protein
MKFGEEPGWAESFSSLFPADFAESHVLSQSDTDDA